MNDGYIKLHRKMLDWAWFKDGPVLALFIYCLLKATWQPREAVVAGHKVELQPGQFVFGRRVAAKETGLTEKQVRIALLKLLNDKCLNRAEHTAHQFSIITICNWEIYQSLDDDKGQALGQARAKLGPSSGQARATDKNSKKSKKVKNNTPLTPQGEDGFCGNQLPDALNAPIFLAAWADWVEHRKQIKKKLTPLAVKKQLTTLAALGPASAAHWIANSIAQGWQGIYPPKGTTPVDEDVKITGDMIGTTGFTLEECKRIFG